MNPLPPTTRPLSPLRAELFSTDQLQSHAVDLASGHQIDAKRGPNRLLQRLGENEKILLEVYDLVTSVEAENRRVAPAGEWLLDNFYLIEQHIRASRLHLPSTYSQELPRLLNSPAGGLSASLCHCSRADFSRGWPGRCGEYQPLYPILSNDHSADAGRAVGGAHHVTAWID